VKDSISTTGTFNTSSPTTITVSSATGISIGMRVIGTGVASDTIVTNVSGTTITINKNVLSNQNCKNNNNLKLYCVCKKIYNGELMV
jgi:hypothetical protein